MMSGGSTSDKPPRYPHWSRGANLYEDSNPPQYHLIIDVTDYHDQEVFTDPTRYNQVVWNVNRELEDVFYRGGVFDARPRLRCPLEHEGHFLEQQEEEGSEEGEGGGRRLLKVEIKVSPHDHRSFSDVATDFCQRLFTNALRDGVYAFDRISSRGGRGGVLLRVMPRPMTSFERIWVSSFAECAMNERDYLDQEVGFELIERESVGKTRGRWLINTFYITSTITTFYRLGSWNAQLLIHRFGIRAVWDAYRIYGSLTPGLAFCAIRLSISVAVIMIFVAVFGPIYANDYEAKIRDQELYRQLQNLEWPHKCDDAIQATQDVLSSLEERRSLVDTPKTPTDQRLTTNLTTFLHHHLPKLHKTTQHLLKIHTQIQRNDESLAKLYFIITAISAGIWRWAWKLHMLASAGIYDGGKGTLVELYFIVVAGAVSVIMFGGAAGYVGFRAGRGRGRVWRVGDVNNRIIEAWKTAQEARSLLVWVYTADRGSPRFSTDDRKHRWNEWMEGVDMDMVLNDGFYERMGHLRQYLGEVRGLGVV